MGDRRLVVFMGSGSVSVATGSSSSSSSIRDNKSAGKWGVYAEIACGGKSVRTPVIEARVENPRRASLGMLSRRKKQSVNLKLDWKGWFTDFSHWARTMQVHVALFVKNENQEEVQVTRTYLPLSGVKTSTMNRTYSMVGEHCEARQSIGMAAMRAEDVPPMSNTLLDEMRFEMDDSRSFSESKSVWSGEDVSDFAFSSNEEESEPEQANRRRRGRSLSSSGDGETQRALDKTKRLIRDNCAKNGWRSLLTGPLDGETNVTFSRNQTQEIFENLGVKLHRREWGVLMRFFDKDRQDHVPLETLRVFLNEVETYNSAIVQRRPSGTRYGSHPGLTPFDEGDSDSSGMSQGGRRVDHSKCPYQPGDKVEARFMNGSTFLEGVVEKVRKQGKALEIRFMDGSYEKYVPLNRVRPLNHEKRRRSPRKRSNDLSKHADLDDSSSDEEERGRRDDDGEEENIYFDNLSPDAQRALQKIQMGIRRAQNAALSRNAVFSFASLMEDHADIPTRPGRMSNESFREALDTAEIEVKPQHLEALISRLDTSSRGSIDWRLLLKLLEAGDGTVSNASDIIMEVNETIIRLKRAVKRSIKRGIKPLDVFEMFDAESVGQVNVLGLEKACALLGATISKREAKALEKRIRLIAPNTPTARVDYRELLSLLEVNEDQLRRKGGNRLNRGRISAVDMNDAVTRIRKQIHEISEARCKALDVSKPFEEMDRTGEGIVTFLQFTTGLQKLGLIVPIEDVQAVAAKCSCSTGKEFSSTNSVDYRKFESLICTDLSIAYALKPQLARAAARGISAWASFRALDRKETGMVSRVDFRKTLLSTLGLRMKEHELRRMMDKFSNKGKHHRVCYVDFLDFVAPNGEAGNMADNMSGMEAKLRHLIRASMTSQKDTQEIFGIFDKKGRNFCTHEEFFHGLERIGLRLSGKEKQLLLTRFDPRANGRVDYGSFVKFAGFTDLEMDQLASRLMQRLREVTAEGVDYRLAFQVFDMGKSGFVTKREFREGIRTLGLPLTEAELYALMRRFAQFDNDDLIQYEDFLRFILTRQDRAQSRAQAEDIQEYDRVRRKHLKRSAYRRHKNRHDSDEDDDDEHRLTVNGSGYDGLGMDSTTSFLRSVLLPSNNNNESEHHGEDEVLVNAWLQRGASEKERKQFHSLDRSIKSFKEDANMNDSAVSEAHRAQTNPEVFYDHTSKTVNRVVDHGVKARTERFEPTFVDPIVAQQIVEPIPHNGMSQVSLYATASDWKLQWGVAKQEDDPLRSIMYDVFYKSDDEKDHKRRRHKSRKRKSHHKHKSSPRGRSKSPRHRTKHKSSTKKGSKKRSSRSRSSSSMSSRAKWEDEASSSSSGARSSSSEESFHSRRSRAKSSKRRSRSRSREEKSDDSSSSSSHSQRSRSTKRTNRHRSRDTDSSFDPIARDRTFNSRKRSSKK